MHPPAADACAASPPAAEERAPLPRSAPSRRAALWLPALTFLLLGCPREAPEPSAEGEPLLPTVAAGTPPEAVQFSRLTLEIEGRSTTLERRKSGWWLIDPVEFPADPVAVEELLAVLRRGALRERIAEAPDAATLRELGLSPPRLRLMAAVEGGADQVLEAGTERAFDGSIPLRRGGEAGVHAGSGHLRRVLERDADALRAKRLFPFRPEEVAEISVRTPGSEWTLVREEGGWKQRGASAFEADPDRVLLLLRRLLAVQARSYEDDNAPGREARGLVDPETVIALRPREGAAIRVELSSLGPGPERTLWVRWRIPDAEITFAQVDARLQELAATPLQSLRSTRLLRFEADAVARVELIDADGGRLVLERAPAEETEGTPSPPAWSVLRGGARTGVSVHRVASLLWNVAQLRAISPRDPRADPLRPAEEGLVGLRLLDPAGNLLGQLAFGRPDPGEGSRVSVQAGELQAFTHAEAVQALRQATRPEAFGVGQGEDGADGGSSPKKDP
ncbi:MAG TPA: DUF4340 domain-containing protein [Myxococcaceae bacterium]|nr:DUF4340 domain-containing protein [Myxococcaceae bacterium]